MIGETLMRIARIRLNKMSNPQQVEAVIVKHMSDYLASHVDAHGTILLKEPLSDTMQNIPKELRDSDDFPIMVYQSIIEAVSIVLAQNNQDLETLRGLHPSKK